MHATRTLRRAIQFLTFAALAGLAACSSVPKSSPDLQCMARAMYFESNRSSDEGMLAVGTVVMNRLQSGKFPKTVCGVVGQKKQFAPGVLSKPMTDRGRERATRVAAEVLRGKRHRGVGKKAMFFHTAGHKFPYNNMHYVLVAGGNAFYEKRSAVAGRRNATQSEVARAAPAVRPARRASQAVHVAAVRPAAPPARSRPARVQSGAPLLAVAPVAPAPASIEDLILASGGG